VLGEYQRLGVFENILLRGIFGSGKENYLDQVNSFHNLYFSPDIIRRPKLPRTK
jgi:hypothetical protein